MAPPEEVVGLAPGQLRLNVPGGVATLEVTEGVAELLPPEFVKLP